MEIKLLILTYLVGLAFSACPHDDEELELWSEASNLTIKYLFIYNFTLHPFEGLLHSYGPCLFGNDVKLGQTKLGTSY